MKPNPADNEKCKKRVWLLPTPPHIFVVQGTPKEFPDEFGESKIASRKTMQMIDTHFDAGRRN